TASAGSSMNFKLAGHNAGTSFGQIKHGNQMTFGGNFNVTYANGFTSQSGDTFPLVVYASHSGQFGTMSLPALPSNLTWRPDYGSTAFSITARPIPTCTPAPNGLLAWWSGDGGTNLAGWYSLVATNGATNGFGIDGRAFLLNGVDQYWYAADSVAFRPTNVTIECWVNFAAVTSLEVIAGKPYGSGNLDSYQIWLQNGQLRGGISTTGGFSALASYSWTPPVSSWHHVGYTYNQATALGTLFLDGVVVATASGSGPIAYDNRPFIVGADIENGNPTYFFNGSIDEVALYDRALATNEIAALRC
ncbi:MAG: C-terminal target protein, partial [Verrucomicrobiales bacterium]|nr:C-terminal target protein [Verrucomicrobiales bacterium]